MNNFFDSLRIFSQFFQSLFFPSFFPSSIGYIENHINVVHQHDDISQHSISQIFEFIKQGKLGHIEKALDSGLSIEQKNFKGETLLCCALNHGQEEISKYLIDKGAKIVNYDLKNNPENIIITNPTHEILDYNLGEQTNESTKLSGEMSSEQDS